LTAADHGSQILKRAGAAHAGDEERLAPDEPHRKDGQSAQATRGAALDREGRDRLERERERPLTGDERETTARDVESTRRRRAVQGPDDGQLQFHADTVGRPQAAAIGSDRRRLAGKHGWGRRGDGYGPAGMTEPIRVLIVDDHAVVRTGIKLLLGAESDIEPVAEAGTRREAIFEARSANPDVILLDVVMPDGSGLESIPQLLHERPEAKVLVLSMQDDPRYVREAFAAGASGYILKEAADVEVVGAVREVARGGRYVHPELGARLIAADADAARKAEQDPLSEREREVLRLLAYGHTNQEIAKQLFISVRTAETHRAHIMQKLRLASRAELVRYAIAQGMLED
jgi:two-component system, NarL family, response regulator NreC